MYQFILINEVWVNKDIIAEIEFQPAVEEKEFLSGYLFRMKDKDEIPRWHPLKDEEERKKYELMLFWRL